MNRIWIIGAMAGATLVAAASIRVSMPGGRRDPAPAIAVRPATLVNPPTHSATAVSARHEEYVVSILGRPLMSASRRPPASAVAQEPDDATPRLSGIVVWPGGRYAIFQSTPTAPSVVLEEGMTLQRWMVRSISADGVVIASANRDLVLRPTFLGDSGIDPAPAPVALRGRDPWGRHLRPPTYLRRRH